jgi:hypothetical protein
MFLLVSLVLAWVMVCIGPSLVAELPQFKGVPSRWVQLGTVAFIAGGLFLAALATSRCFPLASWKLRFVCEALPVLWLISIVLGGIY